MNSNLSNIIKEEIEDGTAISWIQFQKFYDASLDLMNEKSGRNHYIRFILIEKFQKINSKIYFWIFQWTKNILPLNKNLFPSIKIFLPSIIIFFPTIIIFFRPLRSFFRQFRNNFSKILWFFKNLMDR